MEFKEDPHVLVAYGISFSPSGSILATLGKGGHAAFVWKLDYTAISGSSLATSTVQYSNAKVVLVGESSTGKTCIGRALIGKPFKPQESTHGMNVWLFNTETSKQGDKETIRETLLWDLAGQTDYQVIHQLFLDDTALGVITFDATRPENPFGGVVYWEKAFRKVAGENVPQILVAGRIDRGHPTATQEDINDYVFKHGFKEFVATSAKTGDGIDELKKVILDTIQWERLPVTRSPELWHDIRGYLFDRRSGKDALCRRIDLMETFRNKWPDSNFSEQEFNTVIGHAQTQGLVWWFSFGDFVLLKPELLNDYASAIVRAARKHPKGLGCVVEQEVLNAKIDFEDLHRLKNKETERSLLHAVVELLLRHDLALREGLMLVFPSKFNRKLPDYPKPPLREVAYNFSGPVEDIYATLVTRLSYSGAFEMKALWKNAGEFVDAIGKLCGFMLTTFEEGYGTLSVFFEKSTTLNAKVLFLRFIHEHLQHRAISGSVTRERIYRCLACGEEVENRKAILMRLEKRLKTIPCQYCSKEIPLIDMLEEKFGDPELLNRVRNMEKEVEEKRNREVGMTTAKAKRNIGEYDVFLAYNSQDELQVELIGEELKRRSLNPWFAKWNLPPGRRFQDEIEKVLPAIKSVAIFVGKDGLGPWEAMETKVAISQFVKRKSPVIPVLLPEAGKAPELPLFLQEFSWVRFGEINDIEAFNNLEWGITGEKPKLDRTK